MDADRFHSCGVPVFANSTITKCKQCEKDITLRINPRLVRTMPVPSNTFTYVALTDHISRSVFSSMKPALLLVASSSGLIMLGNNYLAAMLKSSLPQRQIHRF